MAFTFLGVEVEVKTEGVLQMLKFRVQRNRNWLTHPHSPCTGEKTVLGTQKQPAQGHAVQLQLSQDRVQLGGLDCNTPALPRLHSSDRFLLSASRPHLQMTTRLTSMSLPFDQPHPQGLLPCQAQEHAVDVTMDEDNCLNQPVRTYHQGTWADEDMFPVLLPPTEQDLTKLLLEGQGEAGGGSLGAQPLLQPAPYGQSGISMSHLDLRANPSW